MLFNSLDFAVFLPLVFILYWSFQKNRMVQNVIILLASYTFYAFWDWRFLGLLAFSTIVDFFIGSALHSENKQNQRKLLLWTSISINLGLLAFFKYHNFFLQSFIDAFSFFGFVIQGQFLNIILPLGISFYTFQTISYTIDIYRRKLEPTNDFVAFAAFVSFFPQLVAGPIERSTTLLPQFRRETKFSWERFNTGLQYVIWGLFKKVVIADRLSYYVNLGYNDHDTYTGGAVFCLTTVLFAFQLYCDFSAYSDIAKGIAKILGYDLMENFNHPFSAKNITDFWRKWHISLST